MEYVQERVATLHDYNGASPPAPTGRATVVIPLAERDHASLSADRVFSTLETVDPERVVVALRSDEDDVGTVKEWLDTFDLQTELLWCTAPSLEARLAEDGLDGTAGKGRDVWLALGVASQSEYVAVHDADATTYSENHVPRLLFPLENGYEFTKGYYARVEDGHLYGRLFRLFYRPLVQALAEQHDVPYIDYLNSFRYALAGEFAMTGDAAREFRAPRGWGLEVGTLGDAFKRAGFEGTAQVDLGVHKHEHRSVEGPSGLGEMCEEVGATLFHTLRDHGIEPSFPTLAEQYKETAGRLIEQYAADAAFNGLTYDSMQEHEQVAAYSDAIREPPADTRLPTWENAPIDPETVSALSAQDITGATR